MTKEEALKLAKKWFEHNTYSDEADEVYEAIEQALAQPEQEPVAYWNFNNGFSHCMIDRLNEAAKKNPAPLYTTPPPCPTCEALARTVMMDQTGRVA